MRAHLVPREALGVSRLDGMVLCQELRDGQGRTALKKGQILRADDISRLGSLAWSELHLLEMDAAELHEDVAGKRIAHAAGGDGIEVGEFAGGHWPLSATQRGVLDISVEALRRANGVDGVCVYTLYTGQIVDASEVVARSKITPFVLARDRVERAESIARDAGGLVRVRPFQSMQIGAVVQETLDERARARFRDVLGEKLAWFGSTLGETRFVRSDAGAVAEGIEDVIAKGARIVVLAGTKAMDPLDPTFVALERLGASLERYGVPAHPGSLFWLARYRDVPIIGMPTCGLFSQATTFDLILPRILAGERVGTEQLSELGHGGLLTREMSFRFPPYRPQKNRGEIA